ncbi:trypsin-like peptidase domain-containing protein [Taklimakanibacter deserti]|uniref:trypsin-like peptidase domain-containing protein n=1 Tax=Taklimakanibacter deserti TaxID=2267839 RepID=UPI000E65A842
MGTPVFWKISLAATLGCFVLASPALGIRIGSDDRMTFGEFASASGLKDSEVQRLFSASVRIVCPWGTGGAALIGDGRVFVTADHVIFGTADEELAPLVCYLESFDGKQKFQIDAKTLIRGKSVQPKAISTGDNDWTIGRIRSAVAGIVPYRLGRSRKPGQEVIAVSQGQLNWKNHTYPTPSIGKCRILSASISSDYTDCDSDKGSSGATLLGPVLSTGEAPELIGIGVWTYYGPAGAYSSKDCDDTRKCATQYVGIRGKLRKAILKMLAE